jgi:hypothetical protein
MTPGEFAYLNEIRKGMDLPPLMPGRAKCLACDRVFDSEDVKSNRICPECRNENGDIYDDHSINQEALLNLLEWKDIYGRLLPLPTCE